MIQIYGAGIAGTFLYHLLSSEGLDVAIYDRRKEPDCRCAWGIVYSEAKSFYSKIGINFDEYVILKPEYVVANGIWLKNRDIVMFDKKKLLSDLWVEMSKAENPEVVIDATGASRAILPRIENDRVLPTVQTTEKHDIEPNLYIQMERTGYAWAFPLGDGWWHIGAGNIEKGEIGRLLNELRDRYGFNSTNAACNCVGKVRMLPPSRCRPFISGNVVGVGEAIGCVSGAGEGNAPALASAKILADCLLNSGLERYEEMILKELEWIENEQRFVDAMLSSNHLTALRLLPKIIAVESKRTVQHSLGEIRKLIGI